MGPCGKIPIFYHTSVALDQRGPAPLRAENASGVDNHSPKGRSHPADTCGIG